MRPHRLTVRTSPFHGGNPGSIPCGDANFSKILEKLAIRPTSIRAFRIGKLRQTRCLFLNAIYLQKNM